MQKLDTFLTPLSEEFLKGEWITSIPDEDDCPKIGRPPIGDVAMTKRESSKKYRKQDAAKRLQNIAVLDFETDPFDKETRAKIFPFVACLYSDNFEPVLIWEENHGEFIKRVIAAITSLPDRYTIYAHNGGRFDYMFFVSNLRGEVRFKGRAIMSATLGNHELRDSLHIIPEALAAFQKEKFDYEKMKAGKRNNHRQEIIDYLLSDCRYLLDIVKTFVSNFGLKLTIGAAAIASMREHYDVAKFSESWDAVIRNYFFGGRVECLQGRGRFQGNYKLFDVNSMYPYVMANFQHPIGGFYDYAIRYGQPGPDTVFLDVECVNHGALVGKTNEGETTANIPYGVFRTTIWEYGVALKYGLIENVKVKLCIDCKKRSDFSKFVIPKYNQRIATKDILSNLKERGMEHSAAFIDTKRDDMIIKYVLNNGYGVWAINPRNFKQHWLTDPGEMPPPEWFKSIDALPPQDANEFKLPVFECEQYAVWEKPNPSYHFKNVGVAASITGAARAVLLEALQHAKQPIYCDTDSIICLSLDNVPIDKTALGAWDLEDEFTEVIICGKKLYGCWYLKPRKGTDGQLVTSKIRSKGVSDLTWSDIEAIERGDNVISINRAPTMDKFGSQKYLERTVRATASIRKI